MKKTLKQTIILFIVLNLMTAAQVLAQDVVEEENQEVPETQAKEADLAQREAEIAAKTAKQEAKIAQEQIKAAEKQLLNAREQSSMYKDKLVDLRLPQITIPHLQHSGGGGILIVPSGQTNLENLAAITEDMSVMSGIFDKKLSQSGMLTARGRLLVGFDPFFGRGNRTPEAIYLEGYGALFLLRVNMPLSAPPEHQQEEKAQEDTDPVWAEMRREMYEPEVVGRGRTGTDERPEEKYDADKVESLKANLIKTLKHATNIRALKSDQLVILTVIGDGGRPDSTVTGLYSYGRSTGRSRIVQTLPEVEAESVAPTVLTISAKKSDIDAFAKGELDYDQFRQRIGIFKSYAKAGQQDSPNAELHQFAQGVLSVE
jgi:hypothetical protein